MILVACPRAASYSIFAWRNVAGSVGTQPVRDSQVDGASMTFIRSVWVGNDSDAHFVLPHLICLEQQIQDRDKLLHACHDCHFGRFTFRFQMRIECFDGWVVPDRDDCGHVQHSSHLASSATDKSLARPFPRVTIDWSDTNLLGDLPAIELAKLG